MFEDFDRYFQMLFGSNILSIIVGALIILPIVLLVMLLIMKAVDKQKEKHAGKKETDSDFGAGKLQ